MSTINTAIFRRLVRIESKLHNLMDFLQMPRSKQYESKGDIPIPPTVHNTDLARTLVRLESKLHALMLHEGLNPYERITVQRSTDV